MSEHEVLILIWIVSALYTGWVWKKAGCRFLEGFVVGMVPFVGPVVGIIAGFQLRQKNNEKVIKKNNR